MLSTVWTIVVAAGTAVVATLATGLLVIPRLEARKKRIGDAHAARDTFNAHLQAVLAGCTHLRSLPANDPGWTPLMRERMTGERERWLQQLDDATQWMSDHVHTYASAWAMRQHIEFAINYAIVARMLMLSEREETTKLELLSALTLPVQRQFFAFWWTRARHYANDQRTFAETLARITGEPTAA